MNRKSRFLFTVFAAVTASGLAATAAEAKTVVTMNTVQIFGTIDPAKISDYTDYMAAVNLYDGLVNVDPAGNLVPELAESWTVSRRHQGSRLQAARRRQVFRRHTGNRR